MSLEICLSFICTFFLSLIFVPVIGKISKKLGIIAHTNQRTIHKGIIARTGGYAIYISFLIGASIFLKTDIQINSILIGGFIIFMTGFYDDIHDISPKLKLLGQIAGALVVILLGDISLKGFTLPLLPENVSYVIAIIITIIWIVGITNAVNLIDGLDGLCAGISIIVLVTISLTSLSNGRTDISSLSLLLAGAIGGFLVYNFHPASIFLGDCGALFIGYMIAVISLLGFGYKSSSFFTLGAPMVVLMVPIMDTIIAIIRRKVHHKSFSEADRGHLHHKLMFSLELGQTKSVLILYFVTILFSLCSYLYLYDHMIATIVFVTLMVLFEIFVEITNMIDRKYKPILTILNIFIKSEYLPSIKDTKPYRRFIYKAKTQYLYLLVVLIGIVFSFIFIMDIDPKSKPMTTENVVYQQEENQTPLMGDIYNQLTIALNDNNKEAIGEYVAAYFACDYYTLSNKTTYEIGGMDYFYSEKINDFETYAKNDYYENVQHYIDTHTNMQEVVEYQLISFDQSNKALAGLEDYTYYDVVLDIEFSEENPIIQSDQLTVTITLIEKDRRFSVVALDR